MPAHSSKNPSYKLAKALGSSHHDTINFLSFSPCGRFLASGGDDNYMCIYDCSDPRQCEISLRVKANSQPSAICWHPSTPPSVFIGYGNGGVVKHSINHEEGGWLPGVLLQNGSDRVVSLAWDGILAVATQSTVYIVDQNASDITSWLTVPKPTHNMETTRSKPEPRSVVFISDGSLLIAYLEHGISCWTRDGKTQKWNFHPRTFRIGRFSYNRRTNMFIVHNLYNGFDAYKIKGSTAEHFRSYQFSAPKERNVPLSCTFIEGGKSVAFGTTAGKAMILDTERASTKQVLQHCADDGLVQEMAYGSPNSRGYTLIATTASECGTDTVIKVWVGPATTESDEIDYAGEILEKITAVINRLFEGYYSLRRKRVEIPFVWLVTGTFLIVAIVLAVPTGLDVSGFLGPWGPPPAISFSFTQQTITSFLRAMLRSFFATLSAISAQLQHFIDEDLTIPTHTTVIQGATLIGSVTALAAAATNQHPALSISAPQVETLGQPEPTFPVFHNTHTEVQVAIDYCPTDTPLE